LIGELRFQSWANEAVAIVMDGVGLGNF